jgi:hypothetical protein
MHALTFFGEEEKIGVATAGQELIQVLCSVPAGQRQNVFHRMTLSHGDDCLGGGLSFVHVHVHIHFANLLIPPSFFRPCMCMLGMSLKRGWDGDILRQGRRDCAL